jgi:hypothetical protein
MAILFLEYSDKVTKKQIPIPSNAKKVFKAMAKVYEPYLDKPIDGAKILKSLASDKKYNGRGSSANANGDDANVTTVSFDDARKRLERQDKFAKDSLQYQLYGGELANSILRKGVKSASRVKEVEAVKPPKPTSNADTKPSETKSEEITTPNGKIKYTVTREGKTPRKVHLTEEQLTMLKEWQAQRKEI